MMDYYDFTDTFNAYNEQVHLKACALLDLVKDEYDYCILRCRMQCNKCVMGNRHQFERYVE